MDIGALQQALIEAGFNIDPLELHAKALGPSTSLAVTHFQLTHLDSRPGAPGKALVPDGIAGPATFYALEHPVTKSGQYTVAGWRYTSADVPAIARMATDAAVGDVGQHESPDGSNHVANNKYGNDTQPWCAYFVSWAFNHLDKGSPFKTIASVYGLSEWADTHSRVVRPNAPVLPGDVFLILRADYHGHTGLVVGVDGIAGRLWCVEGNCGNAVRGTIRERSQVSKIIRPIGVMP